MVMSPKRGECEKCGTTLRFTDRGKLCGKCQKKDSELTVKAAPHNMIEDPELAKVDAELEEWYSL